MEDKYRTQIADFWTDEERMKVWTTIELLNLKCYDESIWSEASKHFTVFPWLNMAQQVRLLEKENGHEIEAYIGYLNSIYKTGLWHKGLASSDLVECFTAVAINKSVDVILSEVKSTIATLNVAKISKSARNIVQAFTHGQPAEPITWYHRFMAWNSYLQRASLDIWPMSMVGKISGAVGTGIVTHPQLPTMVSEALNIKMAEVSTQIVPRLELTIQLNAIENLVSQINKIANDLRMLYTFHWISIDKMPIGSSSMSHKINPTELERTIGMCKMVVSMIDCINRVNMDNWLERDLIHSSVEREFLPMIYNHTYYAIGLLNKVLDRVNWDGGDRALFSKECWSSVKLADSLKHESDRKLVRDSAKLVNYIEESEYQDRLLGTLPNG